MRSRRTWTTFWVTTTKGLRAVGEIVAPETGLVQLAFLRTFGTWLVPAVISSFLELWPLARFELRQHGEALLVEELVDGTADLVITSRDPGHPQLVWERVLVEPLRLAVPPNHRLAHRKKAKLAEVADESFIMLRQGYALRETTELLCADAGFAPRICYEADEVATVRGLVTAGLGVSLLPLPQTATFPPSPTRHPAPHLGVNPVGVWRPPPVGVRVAWGDLKPCPTPSRWSRTSCLTDRADRQWPLGHGPAPSSGPSAGLSGPHERGRRGRRRPREFGRYCSCHALGDQVSWSSPRAREPSGSVQRTIDTQTKYGLVWTPGGRPAMIGRRATLPDEADDE